MRTWNRYTPTSTCTATTQVCRHTACTDPKQTSGLWNFVGNEICIYIRNFRMYTKFSYTHPPRFAQVQHTCAVTRHALTPSKSQANPLFVHLSRQRKFHIHTKFSYVYEIWIIYTQLDLHSYNTRVPSHGMHWTQANPRFVKPLALGGNANF